MHWNPQDLEVQRRGTEHRFSYLQRWGAKTTPNFAGVPEEMNWSRVLGVWPRTLASGWQKGKASLSY